MLLDMFTGRNKISTNPRSALREVSSKMRKTHRLSETFLWFTDNSRPPQMATNSTQRRERKITRPVFKWQLKLLDKISATPRVGMCSVMPI
jgi:hypothetical protein